MIDQPQQVGGRQHLEVAGPRRLAALSLGTDQAAALGAGMDGGGQDAGDGAQRPVEGKLAERHVAVEGVGRQRLDGGQQTKRDGQVKVAALLGEVGGRQVDGDALRRQRQAHGVERGAHPLAAFGHRLVGQADHCEGGQPR